MHIYKLIKMLEGKQGDSIRVHVTGWGSLGSFPEHLKLIWRQEGRKDTVNVGGGSLKNAFQMERTAGLFPN